MFLNFLQLWLNWSIEIMTLFGICFIISAYLCNSYFKYDSTDIVFISMYLCIIMLYVLFRSAIIEEPYYILNNYFICNDFNTFIKKAILSFMLCYLIFLHNFNDIKKLPMFEYLIIIFSCLFSFLIIIKSNHLFVIFLFLEIINLCVYCLLGLNKDANEGIEGAYKYFVQSSLATIIGFFGISLIYLSTGTLFLNDLGVLVSFDQLNWVTIIGIYFVMTTIFFKLGIFPLHSWIAEIYQGSLLISLIFIALLPKIVYVILFLKLYTEFHLVVQHYCLFLSLYSIIYGSLASLYQTRFKRLLAFGSMVHIGLIIFSISIYTINSIVAGLFYLFVYIILTLFVFAFMFLCFEKSNNKLYYIDDISQFYLYFSNNIILIMYFSLIIFSLAGLPFFVGFIAKWYIFIGLIDSFYILEVLLLLSISILASSYYIRLLRFIYFSFKIYKVKRYSVIKYNIYFFNLLTFLFIINVFTIVYHNIIFLIILKNLLLTF